VLQSAGFSDQNASPIIPQSNGAGIADIAPAAPTAPPGVLPKNTNPLTPANPDVGMTRGIEAIGAQ
jgi:hypothetical protein